MSSHSHARTLCTGNAISGAFSALHLLRSYSLFAPNSDLCRYEAYPSRDYSFVEPDILSSSVPTDSSSSPLTSPPLSATFPGTLLQPPFLTAMPPLMQSLSVPQTLSTSSTGAMSRHFVTTNGIAALHRRPRSEKKPIPDDQKDEKYYERRKRNNQAAKKSRDARKIREDHIALRATMLEHENAILKAQIVTLREEAQSLRHMLIKQHTPAIQSIERSLSSMTPVTLSPPHTTASLDC
ncbi:PREDICTED: cell death specification protein 2-like [Trachymyrmex cornetzi]|uniref:D site-binding protein n=1 Tax=Trachymyrmex cornetzi TaxID=471704 RepID=A0A151J380_9HYME|nr:PREDICTED: cell death specification protein 2-like [Trachymyrmex cornetzi]KYN16850.1 D site-binding protein [Trachymyrmex cornetzi]